MQQDLFKEEKPIRLFNKGKIFYKIGEVSNIIGVEPYVLRYWETEFQFLAPRKSKKGQRVYTSKDIEMILRIKKMLYEDKYTIEGVRGKISNNIKKNRFIDNEKNNQGRDMNMSLKKIKDKIDKLLEYFK